MTKTEGSDRVFVALSLYEEALLQEAEKMRCQGVHVSLPALLFRLREFNRPLLMQAFWRVAQRRQLLR